MREEKRHRISIFAAFLVLLLLSWLTVDQPPDAIPLLPVILFGLLLVFTTTFSVVTELVSLSLQPMTTLATFLVLGMMPAAWVTFIAALVHEWVRQNFASQLAIQPAPTTLSSWGRAAANAALQSMSILIGGWLFIQAGGTVPLESAALGQSPQFLVLGFGYLAAQYLLAMVIIAMRGRDTLRLFVHSLGRVFLYEAAPLVVAPLMALVYAVLGVGPFLIFAFVIVAASLMVHNLARSQRRLERRVQELSSLHSVGQALGISLDLDEVLTAVFREVQPLIPGEVFYVALYDAESEELSFPMFCRQGRRQNWPPRRLTNGLTEYVLRQREPLLLGSKDSPTRESLGVLEIGDLSASWLGVPILAGDDCFGVIAVQSFTRTNLYDIAQQELLATIAAQAGMAIQNARLYAQTDKALARRVQELGSILRTIPEGILLLDRQWRVVTANRALARFAGISQSAFRGMLDTGRSDGPTLARLLGFDEADYKATCRSVVAGEAPMKEMIMLGERPVERTLSPVLDRQGHFQGCLMVFRDLTEEQELARLRDDLTHMLVHDLRSPLSLLTGSLEMVVDFLDPASKKSLAELLTVAENSGTQMHRLVNSLLEISRLESGQMPLTREWVMVTSFLEETVVQFSSSASEYNLELRTAPAPTLPELYVDPGHLRRILHNLVDNAVKFTPDGGQILLSAKAVSEPINGVLLAVKDTGPGVPLEAQPYLFKKFRQVAEIKGRRRGTGLGLPYCKLAVEAHSGRIWVDSEPGQGCTFYVALPMTTEDALL